jgi:hypothetical protein
MRQATVQAMVAADASVNQIGNAIPSPQIFYCSVQVVSIGASTGSVKLQFSNDVPNQGVQPANWIDIPGATISVPSASVVGIPKTELCYNFIRAVYTKNNGSAGSVSVSVQTMGN